MSLGIGASNRINHMGRRMPECKQPRMQRLAREALTRPCQRFGQPVGLGAEGLAVVGIADHRMADMGHMDADLVGAAGLQPAFDE